MWIWIMIMMHLPLGRAENVNGKWCAHTLTAAINWIDHRRSPPSAITTARSRDRNRCWVENSSGKHMHIMSQRRIDLDETISDEEQGRDWDVAKVQTEQQHMRRSLSRVLERLLLRYVLSLYRCAMPRRERGRPVRSNMRKRDEGNNIRFPLYDLAIIKIDTTGINICLFDLFSRSLSHSFHSFIYLF